MKLNKILLSTAGCICALSASAGTMGIAPSSGVVWSVIGSGGVGAYYKAPDTRMGIGRLAFAGDFWELWKWLTIGAEVGIQQGWKNGFSRNFIFGSSTARTNPSLDLLATAKASFIPRSGFFVQGKGGIAWRSWRISDSFFTSNDAALEGQLGLGYWFTNRINVNLSYQGIVRANKLFGNSVTGLINDLPFQQAGLLSVGIVI